MKGRVFGLIVIATLGIGIMSYLGYFGGPTVQIRGQYVKFNCGEDNIDLKVVAVSDSSLLYLIGKTVSPEISFKQTKLNTFIKGHLSDDPEQSEDFYLVGNLKKRPMGHCSGSVCFKVKMIKQDNEQSFTEL